MGGGIKHIYEAKEMLTSFIIHEQRGILSSTG